MTKEELILKEQELYYSYVEDLDNLRMDYAKKNALYKIGDFVRSVTSIIKIECIAYEIYFNEINVQYCGYKYRYLDKNTITKTKTNNSELSYISNNVIKIEDVIVV